MARSFLVPISVPAGSTGATASPSDNSTKLATTAYVDAAVAAGGGGGGLAFTSRSAAYTFVLGDADTGSLHPAADTTARTWTIPSNASVAFPVGTTLYFRTIPASGNITIAITTDTLRAAGTNATGSRTLTPGAVATAFKDTSTSWVISGVGML